MIAAYLSNKFLQLVNCGYHIPKYT